MKTWKPNHRVSIRPSAIHLRAALNPGRVDDFESTIPWTYSLHPSVAALFSWHDGTDWERWRGMGTPSLFPILGVFYPFERWRSAMIDYIDMLTGVERAPFWRRSWFPIFGIDLEALAVECDPDAPDYGAVWLSSLSAITSDYLTESLDALLTRVIQLFEAGRFEFSIGGIVTNPQVGMETVLAWLGDQGVCAPESSPTTRSS